MDRKAICESPEPCVIVAPSGMLTGGASVQFLRHLAGDPKNAIIFVGYQAALSLGRKIQNGAREVPILGDGGTLESLKVNLEVFTADYFGGHSDWGQLLSYCRNLRPKPSRIVTMHGEEARCEELSRTLNRMMRVETRAPMNLDTIRLR
jgi:predicted metal-dependent RNase